MSRLSFLIDSSTSAGFLGLVDDLCTFKILLNECVADELVVEDERMAEPGRLQACANRNWLVDVRI